MPDDDRRALADLIKTHGFIPGGRYLYYAGREAKYYNNCGVYETKLLTDKGWVKFGDYAGQTVNLLSPVSGEYLPAVIYDHGTQDTYTYTLVPLRGRSKIEYKVTFTENHKWLLINGTTTENLSVGDVLPANTISLDKSDEGFAHGFVFGDGNSNGQLRLCAKKDLAYLDRLSKVATSVTYPEFANGNPCLYFKQGKNKWKNLPDTKDPEYIASFIMGWIAADGHDDRMLCSVNKEALEWFREHAAYAGLVITGDLRFQDRDISIGGYEYNNHRIYIQNWCRGSAWAGFKVIDKTFAGHQRVYCPFEPEYNQIIINHGIRTFNCYLLRGEEDTREEWANLFWRASSCLMTGGGIGVDYSVFRESGAVLRRTGGIASGPIPLMEAINGIGSNVMQGGSRRSAIYASLNWQHPDIPLFLKAKNWHEQYITPTLTHKQAKQENFNHRAPLDMTNISVNYDDAALRQHWDPITGKEDIKLREFDATNPIFLENCRQALMTGEPGFSFNFGDKQNETLRNAPLGGDTHVLLKNGSFPIKDIVGEEVEVWTGKQWAKTTFKLTKEYADTVNVYISGRRMIVAEPSHEFFLENGEKKPASELQVGDALMVSMPNPKPFSQNPRGYTLGYIYGDGTFHKKYPRAEITFCTNESKQCVDALDQSMLNSVTWNDSRGYTRVYTKNDSILNKRSKEVFPYDLLDAGTDFLCSFIAGLFDSDGNYFEKRNLVRLASKHLSFLHGVRHCLEQLGILCGISTAGVSTYGKNLGYLLTVYGPYVNRFAEIIPTKRLKVKGFEPYRISKLKVLGTEKGNPQDVYCCDVGVEEHAFMAEGVIVSNCTEVTSEDDSDVCNLGSINMGAFETLEQFKAACTLGAKFLICGSLRADLPYDKVRQVRERNRRVGLGLMGIHEWLLKRGYKYEVVPELHKWLAVYRDISERAANEHCDHLYISRPVAYRAIAPTGTIGILASTTTGIEPLFAVAFKRRFLTGGTKWKYQFVVDATADHLIREYGVKPESIETALDLANDYERRIRFQADVQDYVDMSISSTINLPAWGTPANNDGHVDKFAEVLAKYAPRLRGFTCYPDGSRGGQPLTAVPYEDAIHHKGVEFEEMDICDISGKGGSCGV
jgi:ribonucleotide reductase alpha subunit